MTFATTYAIGRVAQRYYAGGRTLDAARSSRRSRAHGRGAATRASYRQQIEQQAATIDTRSLVSLVKKI